MSESLTNDTSNSYIIKARSGGRIYTMKVEVKSDRLFLDFPYNEKLKDEIKAMAGARWHPDNKCWSIANTTRNHFALSYLGGGNPFAPYEKPLVAFTPRRSICFPHQVEMAAFVLTRKQCIFACEMGTGKTLAMIEAMEASGHGDWWWVGPKSALYSVKLEFETWRICDTCRLRREDCKCGKFSSYLCITPIFHTYESLKKEVDNWQEDKDPPMGIVFDESSRLKNPQAQRSQAAMIIAEAIRSKWGDNAWVIEMSGSPAPKSPCDWWHQCEVARPGYIREGNIQKFQRRLAVMEERGSVTGGTYNHLVTYRDSVTKCDICGQIKDSMEHNPHGGHTFIPGKDEVSYLYKRMSGLVHVKFKKDCLNLPDIVYKQIQLEPTPSMKNAASLITAKAPSAIQALTLMRELSDGFQYVEEETSLQECPNCKGTRSMEEIYDADCPERPVDNIAVAAGRHYTLNEEGEIVYGAELHLDKRQVACTYCYGMGEIPKMSRLVKEIPTPKEAALKNIIDAHEECGRLVIFAGFTGSVDRCTGILSRQGWKFIRVDGRGWASDLPGSPMELLKAFQSKTLDTPIGFIGQPGAAGMGLNLTRSPSIVYFSNDFNAESRIQSEARIHRPGMDVNLGATIYDLLCLPSDLLVLNNLRQKKRLQDMTLGQLRDEIQTVRFSDIRSFN